MRTVDNYPAGAANDPRAPYNEELEKNIDFTYALNIVGKISVPYLEPDELDDKLFMIRSLLDSVPEKISDELWNLGIDSKVDEYNSEVW